MKPSKWKKPDKSQLQKPNPPEVEIGPSDKSIAELNDLHVQMGESVKVVESVPQISNNSSVKPAKWSKSKKVAPEESAQQPADEEVKKSMKASMKKNRKKEGPKTEKSAKKN